MELCGTLRADERVHIVTTAVTSELRGDGLPAGEIVFTMDAGSGRSRIAGYQVVLLDEAGHDLVILTVVSPDAQWPDPVAGDRVSCGRIVFERK